MLFITVPGYVASLGISVSFDGRSYTAWDGTGEYLDEFSSLDGVKDLYRDCQTIHELEAELEADVMPQRELVLA